MNIRWIQWKIALVVFAPVLLAALLQPLFARSESQLMRTMLRVGCSLSLIMVSTIGFATALFGLRALLKARWPIVDPTRFPAWPHTPKSGSIARAVGVLYLVLGVTVGASGLFLTASIF